MKIENQFFFCKARKKTKIEIQRTTYEHGPLGKKKKNKCKELITFVNLKQARLSFTFHSRLSRTHVTYT